MDDNKYMKLALSLALKGTGYVNPNPLVGAVIVKNGEIIGKGWHEKYGELHAERNALKNCTASPKDACIYVTLEPCCHFGKTPPCTRAIIESGIKRVVIGSPDPNPLVAGKGVQLLRENGIEVTENVMTDECNAINQVFFHYIKTKTPYVVMKYAMTADGKIATHTGKSKWITGEESLKNTHKDRHKYSAIMVGVNTVITDNPLLTCRIENGRNPIRIICDTNLRTPLESNIVTTAKETPTIIATCCTDVEKQKPYIKKQCKIITADKKDDRINLNTLMKKLGEENIDSILLEGGSTLNWSALNSGIVNKLQAYIAPKIFGGDSAKSPVGGIGVDTPNEAFMLTNSTITKTGDDFLIESDVIKNVHRNN